jgi:hypothetical protein
MKFRAVVEIETQDYHEQQHVLAKFPKAIWIHLSEGKVRFYLPYAQYQEITNMISEWELKKSKTR